VGSALSRRGIHRGPRQWHQSTTGLPSLYFSLSISSSFSLPLLLLPHKSQLFGSLSGEMKEGHGILMGGLTDKRRRERKREGE